MRVFFDTNVLLDVVAGREPFVADSARLWALAETRRIDGVVSTLSFTTVYYIARRYGYRRDADQVVRLLRRIFEPLACDAATLDDALGSGMADFEDAIQWTSAVRSGADVLVTRNIAHLPTASPPVLTPTEFLAAHALDD